MIVGDVKLKGGMKEGEGAKKDVKEMGAMYFQLMKRLCKRLCTTGDDGHIQRRDEYRETR